jgi:hypothetical protein
VGCGGIAGDSRVSWIRALSTGVSFRSNVFRRCKVWKWRGVGVGSRVGQRLGGKLDRVEGVAGGLMNKTSQEVQCVQDVCTEPSAVSVQE